MYSKIKNIQNNWWSEDDINLIVKELLAQQIKGIENKIKVLKVELKNTKWRKADKINWEINILKMMKKDPNMESEIRKKVKNSLYQVWTNSVSSIWNLLKSLEDNESAGLEANILIDHNSDIVQKIKDQESTDALKKLLETVLAKEERTVIIHRYGLFWNDILLLDSLWKKINKSAERVRQIFKNAQNKLSIRSFDEVTASLSPTKPFLIEKKNN